MKAYLAVADCGSFTGAATRLGSTPQLISKYVRALEDEMGAQLFHRTTRKVSPTETGQAFYNRALQLVEDFEALKTDLSNHRAKPSGTLRLTAPSDFGVNHLADLITEFLAAYPDMEIDLTLSNRYIDLLDEGIDVAIRIGELPDSSLVARKLAPSVIMLCASPEYLARAGTPVHPQDLQNHRCIIDTNFRTAPMWRFARDGETHRLRANGPLRVNSATITRSLLLGGQGVGLIPYFQVREDLQAGRLIALLSDYSLFNANIYAVYPPNRHLSAKTRAFVDFIAARLDRSITAP
ncbi:LysR family transcriptional regulator [Actibacterium mucosum]|nr:LysR family transcriptional regulator [Actibacterium mucosum]